MVKKKGSIYFLWTHKLTPSELFTYFFYPLIGFQLTRSSAPLNEDYFEYFRSSRVEMKGTRIMRKKKSVTLPLVNVTGALNVTSFSSFKIVLDFVQLHQIFLLFIILQTIYYWYLNFILKFSSYKDNISNFSYWKFAVLWWIH